MNGHEYIDRLDARAFKRSQQRKTMIETIFIATIFSAGLFCGWAITVATVIK